MQRHGKLNECCTGVDVNRQEWKRSAWTVGVALVATGDLVLNAHAKRKASAKNGDKRAGTLEF